MRAISFSALFAALLVLTTAAQANPEKVFKGQIITSKKPLPAGAESKSKYTKMLKKARSKIFDENEEKKEYKVFFLAFFQKPVNDLEVTVKIFDDRTKEQLTAWELYLTERKQKSVKSKMRLSRDEVGVNRDLLMVIENRGKRLATTKFKIRGKADTYKGDVSFGEDET